MSKSRLVSGRIKKVTGAELSVDRYEFLDLGNAEPDLGNPDADGSILVADIDGTRYWTPNTPSVGAIDDLTDVDTSTVPPTDGQALVYDNASGIWKPGDSAGDSAGVTSSTTPPESPNENDLWFNTENLNLYIYYNDGDSVQWVQVNTAGASGTGGGEGGGGGGGGSGVVVYDTVNELPLSNNTAGDQAYVTSTNRLYLWTGNGWFNIALINTNPTITQGPNAAYSLNRDGSPTVITLIAQDPEGIPITWSYQVTTGTLGSTATIVQADNVFTITPSTDRANVGTFGVTFVASDGVNIATAISSFKLFFVAADQYYNQSILLTTSTVDGGDNNTFIDSSTNNFTITRNGNTTQGAFSPYGDRWSNYFNENYLSTPSSTGLSMGTSNFTFEIWYYPTDRVDPYPRIFQFGSANWGSSDNVAILDRHDDANTKFGIAMHNLGGNAILLQSNTTVTENIWYHIALSREGNTFRLFINGILEDTYTNSGSISTSSSISSYIGGGLAADTKSVGYISDLRIVKGTALYTSNFTPPAEPLTAVAGTSLLTCQSNRFKDSSVNNFTLTKSGDVKVTKFSPYLPTEPYDPSTFSGSAYFDGAGDYVSVPSNTAFQFDTANFTLETWVYLNNYDTYNLIFENGGALNGDTSGFSLGVSRPAGKLYVWTNGTFVLTCNTTLAINTWYHVALVRNNGVHTVYLNGVSDGSFSAVYNYTGTGVAAQGVLIGNNAASGEFYRGYLSDYRVVKGTAVYTSNFTPPTQPIAAVANTSLLCNFTNANIYDETGKIVLETVGNAQVDTAVTKFGTGSVYFDGTGDWLTWVDSIGLAGGDFTIEFFGYNLNRPGSDNWGFFSIGSTLGQDYAGLTINSDGAIFISMSGTNWTYANLASLEFSANDNTWHHYAVCRQGGTLYVFKDGIATIGSGFTITGSIANKSGTILLGRKSDTAFSLNGYIEDLRITKDVARYTANFTPPTQKLGFTNDE